MSAPEFVRLGTTDVNASSAPVLDLTAGSGAAPLGLNPSEVIAAVVRQLRVDVHPALHIPCQLAQRLEHELLDALELSGYRVLPATTGSGAVDLAMRIARRATDRHGIGYMRGSFHGNSTAAAGICGIPGWAKNVEQDSENVELEVPTAPDTSGNEWEETRARLEEQRASLAAIVIEPLQSNRGYRLPAQGFLPWLAHYCRDTGTLLIADEIGSSLGRGGTWLGSRLFGVEPDLAVLGKSLGAGVLPIAAVLARASVIDAAKGPGLGSSLSWSPPACAAALATLGEIRDRNLVERARDLGARFGPSLRILADQGLVDEVFGVGLGWGLKLGQVGDPDAKQRRLGAARELALRGVHIEPNPSLPGLRLMPALTIGENDLTRGLDCIHEVLETSPSPD